MDPRDFFKTAAYLKDQKDEHDLRTSISRSYYAVHLHICQFISKTFLGGKKFTNSPHKKIIACLQYCDAPDIKKIGVKLSKLHTSRKAADYNMNEMITGKQCLDVYDDATDLLSDFENTIAIDTNRQKFALSSRQQARNERILPQ
jgi:uncharacterized protein (UPF0332 family)